MFMCVLACLSINLHPHILCCFVTDCVFFFLKYIPAYLLFFQRAHAGAGKEDGKTCKRVAIRTTIRKDDCRSNAPVGKGEMQADFKPLHVPCQHVSPTPHPPKPPIQPPTPPPAGHDLLLRWEMPVRHHIQL